MDQMLFYNVIDFYRKSHSVKILGKYYNVPAVDDISVSIAELRKKYEVSSTCLSSKAWVLSVIWCPRVGRCEYKTKLLHCFTLKYMFIVCKWKAICKVCPFFLDFNWS